MGIEFGGGRETSDRGADRAPDRPRRAFGGDAPAWTGWTSSDTPRLPNPLDRPYDNPIDSVREVRPRPLSTVPDLAVACLAGSDVKSTRGASTDDRGLRMVTTRPPTPERLATTFDLVGTMPAREVRLGTVVAEVVETDSLLSRRRLDVLVIPRGNESTEPGAPPVDIALATAFTARVADAAKEACADHVRLEIAGCDPTRELVWSHAIAEQGFDVDPVASRGDSDRVAIVARRDISR